MLLGLPEKTEIKKIVSKKQIYEKYSKEFNSNRKRSFNDEIEKITFINEISKYSVNCEEGKEVKRIFVIKIDLRKEKFSDENISLISKLFNQKIIFILNNENKIALAIYQDKLFKTKFDKKENFTLKIEGLNLDRIWENFVLSISATMTLRASFNETIFSYLDEKTSINSTKEKYEILKELFPNAVTETTSENKMGGGCKKSGF